MLMAGSANNRARREQAYVEERRAIEDPYRDRELARTDTARNAIVDTYGVMAGDPTSYQSVQTTDERIQKLPGELASQDLDNRIKEWGLDERINQRSLGAMGNVSLRVAEGLKVGRSAEETLAALPANVKTSLGITPDDEAQIVAAIGGDAARAQALADVFRDPEQFQQLLTGEGPDGKPLYAALSNRNNVTPLSGITPTQPTALDIAEQEARIAATRALATQRNTPKASKAGEEPQDPADIQAMFDRTWDALDKAAGGGAYASSNDPDWLRRTLRGAGASDVGRILGGLTGAKEEELRDNVDAAVSGLRMLFIENPNITSRMFDTPAEQKALMKQLEGGSSIESKIEALRWTENKFNQVFPNGVAGDNAAPAATTGDVVVSFEDFMNEGQ